MADQQNAPGISQPDEQVFYQIFLREGYYLEMGCIAFILYEYLLTINTERKVIWGREWTIPTVLYLLNRSLLLLFALAIFLWGFVNWASDSSCYVAGRLQTACAVLLQACFAIFSGLRVHAINRYNWFWTILVVLLGCVSIPPNMISLWQSRYAALPPPLSGCAETIDESNRIDVPIWNRMAIAAATCSIMRDVVVIGITWYRTAGIAWEARKVNLNTSLVSLMLRDGTTFFALTLALHVVLIVVLETRQTALGAITFAFSSVIMTRFLLNLRTLDSSGLESVSLGAGHVPPSFDLQFASPSAFDNLGAPLDVDGMNDTGDEHDSSDESDGTNEHDGTDGHGASAESHQELISVVDRPGLGEYAAVPRRESLA